MKDLSPCIYRMTYSVLVLLLVWQQALGCSMPDGWRPLHAKEGLTRSEIVVYGRDISHMETLNIGGQRITIDSTFEIYCVLKNPRSIQMPTNITLKSLNYRTHCSDLAYVYTTGNNYLLGLKHINTTAGVPSTREFEVERFVHDQEVIFDATNSSLTMAANICGMEKMHLPLNSRQTLNKVCPSRTAEDPCAINPPRLNEPTSRAVKKTTLPTTPETEETTVAATTTTTKQSIMTSSASTTQLATEKSKQSTTTTTVQSSTKYPDKSTTKRKNTIGKDKLKPTEKVLNKFEVETKIEETIKVNQQQHKDTKGAATLALVSSTLMCLSVIVNILA